MKKVNNRTLKEEVLPDIILKYYHAPRKSNKNEPSGIVCACCSERNIINIGGGFYDKKGRPRQICEKCAVWRYRDDFGFRTLAAARARRRRIFDIGYLFNEMVIDKYMEIRGIKDIKELGDIQDKIFINAIQLYNYLFMKEDKERIEEIKNQTEIEIELRKKIGIIDFQTYFRNQGFL